MTRSLFAGSGLLFFLVACGEPSLDAPAAPAATQGTGGEEFRFSVPDAGRVFVRLASPPAVVGADDGWTLAFEGHDVFTNSGPSGPGQGGAFGPLGPDAFEQGGVQAPFTTPDRTGGAFLDWYAYEGAPAHVLWSRYHVHVVKDGERLWKVQLLGYYGELDGAPVPALYRLRYAELLPSGPGPTRELARIDATAGGASAPSSAPSTCLELGSEQRMSLTPDEARRSGAWHLCFRRQGVSVNGELGGPRGVGAADLDAADVDPLSRVKARTADSELPRFEAVDRAAAESLLFRGDRVVSALGAAWLDRAATPAPAPGSWLVVGADGKSQFLVVFTAFEGASARSPGVISLRVKQIENQG